MEVIVGTGKDVATWHIPKGLLSHHSAFFHAACNGPFKERVENRITFEDCDPGTFQVFVQWIYYGECPLAEDISEDRLLQGWSAWVLGDQIMARGFQNHVMKLLYQFHWCGYGLPTIILPDEADYCWRNTTQHSKLRKFMLRAISLNRFADGPAFQSHCTGVRQKRTADIRERGAFLCRKTGRRFMKDVQFMSRLMR
jgi:hypothetical protein